MKASIIVAVLLLLLPATSQAREREESRLFRALGNAVHVSNAADLIATEVLIASGGIETNPLLKHRVIRTSVKVVAPFVVNHLTSRLYEHDQKALAIAMRLGATCAFTYWASKNLQLSYSVSF